MRCSGAALKRFNGGICQMDDDAAPTRGPVSAGRDEAVAHLSCGMWMMLVFC